MSNDIRIKEALFEIHEAIRQKTELPHELPPENHFRFDAEFPSGIPIKIEVETIGNEGEPNSYFVSCISGVYRTREKMDENLDIAIDLAIWELVSQKYTGDVIAPNPFEKI